MENIRIHPKDAANAKRLKKLMMTKPVLPLVPRFRKVEGHQVTLNRSF